MNYSDQQNPQQQTTEDMSRVTENHIHTITVLNKVAPNKYVRCCFSLSSLFSLHSSIPLLLSAHLSPLDIFYELVSRLMALASSCFAIFTCTQAQDQCVEKHLAMLRCLHPAKNPYECGRLSEEFYKCMRDSKVRHAARHYLL